MYYITFFSREINRYGIIFFMERYEPLKIEAKWQKRWEEEQAFRATEQPGVPKMYLAEMFPYPSGAGLHVGHVRNFTIVDVLTRFFRQQKMNVMRPFGYDTFGLPAENYAIKTGISPRVATKTNIENFRRQAKRLGYAIDWEREISTSDPDYYKWTQWCFLKLYKKGLAYQKESYQWWCPVDKTVLANEQVEGGHCWRCGSEVEKRKLKQWFFKITAYADELLADIDALDWPDKIKTMQKNWIGRSEGALVEFEILLDGTKPFLADASSTPVVTGSARSSSAVASGGHQETTSVSSIKIFTTRVDTIFGATFVVLAPEHPLVDQIVSAGAREKVAEYCKCAIKKSEIERQENKEKTGVFTGAYAKNPLTGEALPIWVSDYVLMGYGEGAIMAVPAHDARDREFAEKFDLPIKKVIEKPENSTDDELCYTGEGKLVNSGQFNSLDSFDAREQIASWLHERGIGEKKVIYRMRDWLISRQRYWGCPIPIAYDKDGAPHPIPEDQLPVIIPEVKDFQPDDSGHSALAKATDWLKVTIDGEEMTRETDTLDGYACSSWYLWRYASPHDSHYAWNAEALKYWEPLDYYCGGDHAVAHLLYVRFWCKFFADQGLLPFREPVKHLLYNGYINAPDGKKMSKSKGNVIDPLDVIDAGYGADTLRTYEMFIGPYDQDAAWDPRSVGGVYRFLNRCWSLVFAKSDKKPFLADASPTPVVRVKQRSSSAVASGDRRETASSSLLQIRHQTIKKVTDDIRRYSFNTAVAALMEYVNELYKSGAETEDLITLAKLLKPFAPHLASEMLEKLQADDEWPVFDPQYLVFGTVDLIVQVNGKLRAKIAVRLDDLEDEAKIIALAKADDKVAKWLNKNIKKTIFIKKAKILSFVI